MKLIILIAVFMRTFNYKVYIKLYDGFFKFFTGIPKFMAINELWEDEFVKNDTIFIKVQIDTSEVVDI